MSDASALAFQKKERPNEYQVEFEVTGTIRRTVNAGSAEEARAKALALLDDDEFALELDRVDDARVASAWKSPDMFLVLRDGRAMQTSRIEPGDQPRSPDERGF